MNILSLLEQDLQFVRDNKSVVDDPRTGLTVNKVDLILPPYSVRKIRAGHTLPASFSDGINLGSIIYSFVSNRGSILVHSVKTKLGILPKTYQPDRHEFLKMVLNPFRDKVAEGAPLMIMHASTVEKATGKHDKQLHSLVPKEIGYEKSDLYLEQNAALKVWSSG